MQTGEVVTISFEWRLIYVNQNVAPWNTATTAKIISGI